MKLKVIVLPTIGVGDLLMFTPALRWLRKGWPEAHIDVFVMKRASRDILLHNPYLNRILFFPLLQDKVGGVKFVFGLRKENYDYSFNIFPSNKKEYNLVSWVVGATKRVGHRYLVKDLQGMNFLNNIRVPQSGKEHGVYENLKLVEAVGIKYDRDEVEKVGLDYFMTDDEKKQREELLRERSEQIFVGIHPGSSSRKTNSFKRWPKEKYSEFINAFLRKHKNSQIFLFGGPEELALKEFLKARADEPSRVHIVEGSIREIAPVLSAMHLMVGNDSSLAHLASALKVPTAVVYGPTNPLWTSPFGVPKRIIRLNLDCSPCYPYSPKSLSCPAGKKYKCLRELPVEMVLEAVEGLLQETYGM